MRRRKNSGFKMIYRLNSTGAALYRREDCPLWERISQSFALFILTVFPFLLGSEEYYNLTVSKFRFFVISVCVYAALCLVAGFVFIPGKRRGKWMRKRTKAGLTVPQIFLAAYVLWAALSTILSPYEDLWIGQSRYEGMCSILLYGVVFLLLSFWGEYTDAYTYGLAVMGIGTGFIAFLQTFGVRLIFERGVDYWKTGFLTTIGHQDCVACLICILIPTLLSGFVILKDGRRWLGIPALFLMTYIAVYSDVDTAKLGFVTVFLLLPWLIETRERLRELLIGFVPILLGAALGYAYHWDRSFAPDTLSLVLLLLAMCCVLAAELMARRRATWSVKPAAIRRGAYVLMLVLLIVALVALYGYSGGNRLVRETSELLHGNLTDEAGTYRGYIWKYTFRIIRDHPVFGGGPGSFISLFLPYDEGYQKVSGAQVMIDFPHNDFLSVAACTGLVGLALYVAFLVSLALRCLRMAEGCPVLLIFLAGMTGYLIYSFFVFSIAIVTPLFWVLAGLADKCVRQVEAAKRLEAAVTV